jgi:arylsulfatase A-like enzyme
MNLRSTITKIMTAGASLILLICLCCQKVGEAPRPPNIILIVADDLGYGDLGCYGQQLIKTPMLDQMAAQGLRFTDFYAGNTTCAPSRCALMTGRHMGAAYVRGNDPDPDARIGDGVPLRPSDTTLAEVLRAAGYATAMFGKWGLGVEGTSGSPEKKGFEQFFGYLNQAHAHRFTTDSLWEVAGGSLFPVRIDPEAYTHALFMERALDFVRQQRQGPFFLYLPITIPHAELLAMPEDMAPYLDENGESIFEEIPFEGRGRYRPQRRPRVAYAAMISRLDADIGRLLALLQELKIDDNTLVLFSSDNGPHREGGHDPDYFKSAGPLRGIKRDLYEGGIRVPLIAWGWQTPPGGVVDIPLAFWDILPTLAQVTGAETLPAHDGISFASALRGDLERQARHDYLYWEHEVRWLSEFSQAIRVGDMKLLRIKSKDDTRVELYDLSEDIGEQRDLSTQMPALTAQLLSRMQSATQPPEHPLFRDALEAFR